MKQAEFRTLIYKWGDCVAFSKWSGLELDDILRWSGNIATSKLRPPKYAQKLVKCYDVINELKNVTNIISHDILAHVE